MFHSLKIEGPKSCIMYIYIYIYDLYDIYHIYIMYGIYKHLIQEETFRSGH